MGAPLRRNIVFGCTLLALVLAAIVPAPIASAHERVTVGEFELIVGWRSEPAFVGVLKGLDLGIQHRLTNGSTEWVTGAQASLTATLRLGTASVEKPLEPQFGNPGWYTFDVIPTREGPYSVRLAGMLNTTAVDVTVNLDPVRPSVDVEFPAISDPTPGAIESLRAQATIALALGFAGLVVGVFAVAWTVRNRRGGRGCP